MEFDVCLLTLFAAQESNDFTEVCDFIPVHVGVTKIRFWSLTVSCIFPTMRSAVGTSVILQRVTRNFSSAMS